MTTKAMNRRTLYRIQGIHQNLSQGSGSIDGLLGKHSIENTQDDPLQRNTQSDNSHFLL